MATIIRSVQNNTDSDILLPLGNVILPPAVPVDLYEVVTDDVLSGLQAELQGMSDRGSIAIIATEDNSQLLAASGGIQDPLTVSSINGIVDISGSGGNSGLTIHHWGDVYIETDTIGSGAHLTGGDGSTQTAASVSAYQDSVRFFLPIVHGSPGANILVNGFYGEPELLHIDSTGMHLASIPLDVTLALQTDLDTTPNNTRMLLWDVNSGSMQRVSVGANDSGGTGYRLLKIPNA